jgi:hypothetical protein
MDDITVICIIGAIVCFGLPVAVILEIFFGDG